MVKWQNVPGNLQGVACLGIDTDLESGCVSVSRTEINLCQTLASVIAKIISMALATG